MTEKQKYIQRQCRGKRRISGRKKARHITYKMSQKHGQVFTAYRCEVCRFWHVGHAKTDFRMWMLGTNKREEMV